MRPGPCLVALLVLASLASGCRSEPEGPQPGFETKPADAEVVRPAPKREVRAEAKPEPEAPPEPIVIRGSKAPVSTQTTVKKATAQPRAAASAPAAARPRPTARALVRLLRARDYARLDNELAAVRDDRFPDSYVSVWTLLLDEVVAVKTIEPLLEDWCEKSARSATARIAWGRFLIQSAWAARGGGWANTVTPEGWRLFGERLRRAKEKLEEAARLEPDRPDAWSDLLVVANGLQLSDEEADGYLAKAAAVGRKDFIRAHIRRLWGLTPRWGGSNEAMFAFARKAIAEHEDEPAFGALLLDAHEDYLSYTVTGDKRAYLARPDVKKDLDGVFSRVLAKYPGAMGIRTSQARVALTEGRQSDALSLYKTNAALGDPSALDTLGDVYMSGSVGRADPVQAVACYRRAAELGYVQSQYALAMCYVTGAGGLPRDMKQALRWFEEAAEMDSPVALVAIAQMYHRGSLGKRDLERAIPFYTRAAELDEPRAQLALGQFYRDGTGVERDEAKSRKWLEKAAARGVTEKR